MLIEFKIINYDIEYELLLLYWLKLYEMMIYIYEV